MYAKVMCSQKWIVIGRGHRRDVREQKTDDEVTRVFDVRIELHDDVQGVQAEPRRTECANHHCEHEAVHILICM